MTSKREIDAYLSEMLALDPLSQTGVILECRRRLRGGPPAETAMGGSGPAATAPACAPEEPSRPARPRQAEPDAPSRYVVQATLESVRAEFWSLSRDEVVARIEAIDLEPFADLRAAGARLLRLAEQLDDMRALERHESVSREFVTTFRSVLIAGTSRAARTRRAALQELADNRVRSAARKSAKIVARAFPGLHRLEAGWLRDVERLSGAGRAVKVLDRFTPRESYYPLVLFILWAVYMLIKWLVLIPNRADGP